MLQNIKNLLEDVVTTLEKKNHDYGGSDNPYKNIEASRLVGVQPERAILVRIMDKMSRISTLLNNDAKVKNESIKDTIQDAIGYLAILDSYLNKNKEKESVHVGGEYPTYSDM